MERVAYEARLPGQTSEARHLAVGSDAAAWYPRHDVMDTEMQAFGRRFSYALWLYNVDDSTGLDRTGHRLTST
jgi:hypothetical protein